MLQKLPSTPGDAITLGTLMAVGISPGIDKTSYVFFATFDCGRGLISYEINDQNMWDVFSTHLSSLFYGRPHPELVKTDYRYSVTDKGYELYDDKGIRVAVASKR